MSELSLQLNDGLDLTLPVAGPGARAFAFVVDFKIRVCIALIYFSLATSIFRAMSEVKFDQLFDGKQKPYLFIVVIPSLVLYFLYHPILELLMGGRSPGKKLAGIRIVDLNGRTPTALQIVIRNVFRLIDSLPFFYGIGILASFFGASRARLGDLAAGTLLVHDVGDPKRTAQTLDQVSRASLSAVHWEFARDLLDRWENLMPLERQSLLQKFYKTIGESQFAQSHLSQQYAELKRLVQ